MNIKYFFVNPYRERTIIVWDDWSEAVIIDPGFINSDEEDKIMSFISSNGIKPLAVLLTHAHPDHIYGVGACIRKFGIPVYMHPDEKVVKDNAGTFAKDCLLEEPDIDWKTTDIADGQILSFGQFNFEVIHTPGHSPGSVCYFERSEGQLFSGDTLFAGSIGKTSHRWGDYDKEIVAIMEKLMGLDSDTAVHPGHGFGTTIGFERTHNPFLEPFNEKDPETGAVDGIIV